MSENYSKLEMALMELDRAVSGLSRQAEGVRRTISGSRETAAKHQADLFSLLSAQASQPGHPSEGLDLDVIERRLDATIAQIEDLLNDDRMVAGHG